MEDYRVTLTHTERKWQQQSWRFRSTVGGAGTVGAVPRGTAPRLGLGTSHRHRILMCGCGKGWVVLALCCELVVGRGVCGFVSQSKTVCLL